MRLMPLALTVAVAATLTSCTATPTPGSTAGATASAPVAVATTTQLGSVLADVTGCVGTTSTTLMGPGDDPHTFAVSSEQVAQMVHAKLVVANGLGLEQGMAKSLANVKADGGRVFEVGPTIDPRPFPEPDADHDADHADDHDHAGHDHGHDHGSLDPHFWMDAHRMAAAAKAIGEQLASTTGDQKYATCGAQVQADLEKVDADVKATLERVPPAKRVLVTDHEAFHYFAAAYGFHVAGVVIPGGSTDAEPSSADLAELVHVIRDEKVSAIFSNNTVNPKLVESVAREVGGDLKVVQLYEGSVGAAGSEAATYAGMMRTNAKLIADALA